MSVMVSVDPGSRKAGWCLWRDGKYSMSGCWMRKTTRSKKKTLPSWRAQYTLFWTDFFGRHTPDTLVIEKPYAGPNSDNLIASYHIVCTLYLQSEIQISAFGDSIDYLRDPDSMIVDVGANWKKPKEDDERFKKAIELSGKSGIVSIDEATAILLGKWHLSRGGR